MHFPYLFEHLGVAVCAVTGALAARGKRVDLFGVVVLALVIAVGGGTVRDRVLGVAPVFWVRDGSFVVTAAAAAGVSFVWARLAPIPHGAVLLADACGLALFTAVGTEKSLQHGAPAVVAVALGIVTGVAGGMIRDTLSGEVPLVFRQEIYLYATAAFCGAVVLVLLAGAGHASGARGAAMATTLVLRLAAIRWRLRLPLFHVKDERSGR